MILIIDNYDSFTYNLVQTIGAIDPNCEMKVVRNDAASVDELEALKLCDRDGLTQEEAGVKMGVSRGTVQRILSCARAKVADALSGCKAIVMDKDICGKIEGGAS